MPETSESNIRNDRPARPRRWLRFSLRWYLAGLLILSLLVSHFLTSRQLGETRRELVKLRDELGYLTVEDPEMVHAIALDTDEENTWRWRVYFPRGHRYEWRLAYEEIPKNGIPKNGISGVSNEDYWEVDNEVLVTATLRQRDDDDWSLSVTSMIGGGADQMHGASMGIPHEAARWMSGDPSTEFTLRGNRGTEMLDPKGPIILLKLRRLEKQPDGSLRPSNGPMPGIMVWLEKIDP